MKSKLNPVLVKCCDVTLQKTEERAVLRAINRLQLLLTLLTPPQGDSSSILPHTFPVEDLA